MKLTLKRKVTGIIDNLIRLKRDTLGPDLLSEFKSDLIRENPAYYQIKRMRDKNPRMANIELPPATIENISYDDETVYLPRGYLRKLKNKLADRNYVFDVEHRTSTNAIENRININIELTSYQKKSIVSLILNGYGICCAPCGGGKTVTGIALISKLGKKSLVLVHTNDLLNQWYNEFKAKTDISSIGRFGAGYKEDGDVVIGMIQTLINLDESMLFDYLSSFGCIVLDEAHHCPASTFAMLMNLSTSQYRFGLTATPIRKDGLEFLMSDIIGDIIVEVTDQDLIDAGRSQTCSVMMHKTTFFSKYSVHQWNKLVSELCEDADRNELIVNTVTQRWNEGHFPLVLSARVSHCKLLERMLSRRGMRVCMLLGEVDKGLRQKIIDESKTGLVDCIVATKVADEGLDIPNLSNVHLTVPTSDEGRIKQRIGRIRRPINGKVCIVDDYYDLKVSCFQRMGSDRKRYYKKWGFTHI